MRQTEIVVDGLENRKSIDSNRNHGGRGGGGGGKC